MKPRILFINPVANERITQGIDESLEPCRAKHAVEISSITLEDGPLAVEDDVEIKMASRAVVNEIWGNDTADAFVIASYADPGLELSRAKTQKPVFGLQESAISMSATYGRRFGVLAPSWSSIQRHIAYVRQLGCQDFHAGERPLDLAIENADKDPAVLQKILETGRQLIDEDGAETLIFGCVGLAMHRKAAQMELGVPIIDPVEAALTMALETLGT
ncbi:MAG: aspartate/glutamate racemase family protein [Woeseiaceae bacterium]|nr:aspartate/glutamate racemase family protein [Woeseiaceae bacterium]